MGEQPAATPQPDAWSITINGVSARLQVEVDDLQPGLRHAVYLQLRNGSHNPAAFTNQPLVHATLADRQGQQVTPATLPTSGPAPVLQWAVVPANAYVALRIDLQNVGVPTRARGTILLSAGDHAWELVAGVYVLRVTAAFSRHADGPPNQWVGSVTPPPIDIVITREMLGPRGAGA
jgi:hypothetical protein